MITAIVLLHVDVHAIRETAQAIADLEAALMPPRPGGRHRGALDVAVTTLIERHR